MDKKLKILGVDDSTVIRMVMKRSFHRLGYASVTMESDGESALEMLKHQAFDLVLTDCCMPGMSGIDLLHAIRADASLRGLPVIMVSGNSGSTIESEAWRAGVDGFLAKPFTDEALEQAIAAIFERVAIAA